MRSIYWREIRGYFDSPMGYGVIGAFVVIMMLLSLLLDPLGGAGGGGDWFKRGELTMRTFFGVFPWAAAVVVPAVSMRLWSEDRRQATFEMLMTLPIPTWRIVLGKYFAGVTFLALMLAGTAAYPLMLAGWGQPDWGPVIGGYIACFVLGAAFVAVGLFVSGLTQNQSLAFFIGMLLCLTIVGVGVGGIREMLGELARSNPRAAMMHIVTIPLCGLGLLAAAVGRDRMLGLGVGAFALVANLGAYIWSGAPVGGAGEIRATTQEAEAIVAAIGQISVLEHFGEIERGVINSNALVLFASYIVLFVVLNVWSLQSRRYS